jgi:hypothetical protein
MNIKVWGIWEKRKRRYWISNSVVLKILKRLYYRLEELIWLGICVGVLVIVLKFIFFLGF